MNGMPKQNIQEKVLEHCPWGLGRPSDGEFLDFLRKLEEAPALKAVLLSRADEEYKHYRIALERNLDVATELLRSALGALDGELASIRHRLDILECTQRIPTLTATARLPRGASPAQIRTQVFHRLRELEERGLPLSTRTIRQEAPSIQRWLYGSRAIFHGLKGLLQDFHADA